MHSKVFAFIPRFPLFLFIVLTSSFAFSAEYYTVKETSPALQDKANDESIDPLSTIEVMMVSVADQFMSLMDWQSHSKKLEDPAEPYRRLSQYGTWVTDPADGTCLNTRGRKLSEESLVPVTLSPKGCTVISGKWIDPYSKKTYSQASDLDIDHMVPLKNSYVSGAWKWDFKKRCLYANFMHNNFHLFAVKDDDNKKKGDSSPEKFMPSDESYRCEYLTNWLKIKLIWNLTMTSSEGQAIETLATENNCDLKSIAMSVRELRAQRQEIVANIGLCE